MNNFAKNEVGSAKVQETEILPAWLQLVREQVRSVKFGTVQITIHDSRVVQIERVEKLRFDKAGQGDS